VKLNRGFVLLPFFVLGAEFVRAQEPAGEAIPNWPAPATWSPHDMSRGVSKMDVGSPLPFIGLIPCRLADTRGNGFTGQYGPPAVAANATRTFTIAGQCSIPLTAAAVSFNFGALNVGATGDLRIFPAGGAVPLVSTLNYNANTPNIANAAVVPLGTGGAITVQADAVQIDLIIDVNGYYSPGDGTGNTFLGFNAGHLGLPGIENTAIGDSALSNNFEGSSNTAVGWHALFNNNASDNTAIGTDALASASTGSNTAVGVSALASNIGGNNTGIGAAALGGGTNGNNNTAAGANALYFNNGDGNTAIGYHALSVLNNVAASTNTAVGDGALSSLTSGIGNVAVGAGACSNNTTGNDNVCIHNGGVNGESNTIRIGQSFHTAAYIGGITGRTSPSGVAVLVASDGKLGTSTSSRRFKQDIRDIARDSDGLMRLRPVTFRYKPELDPTGLPQYGLIAEEVAPVYPDLVAYDRDGRPETVRYQFLVPMLLNEVQKEHAAIEEQRATLEEQRKLIRLLEGRLADLEISK
jgi:hypothetical protein